MVRLVFTAFLGHPLSPPPPSESELGTEHSLPTPFPSSAATCTCPLAPDVLNSYDPFENPPLPILQGLSCEFFHFTPQIRPRH